MNDELPGLGTALRERVADEHPDLDRLISVSTRTGTRLRRRRTAALSAGTVAAGVAVVGIVGASLGGAGRSPGVEPGFASQPPAASLRTAAPSSTASATTREPAPQVLPVRVAPALPGWVIGEAGDDKFPATKGRYALSVTVRPLSERAAWSGGDPDRPATQVAHVGRNYFVTVQPGPGVPQDVVDELVAALRYSRVWHR